MDPSPLFCSGLELGKLAVGSGLLRLSWTKISELNGSIDQNQESNLRFRIYREAKYTVVAFVAPPICTRRYLFKEDGSINSASTPLSGSSAFNPFQFLCSGKISSFSVHSPALQLFASVFDVLSGHKSQLLNSEKPLIITGPALGGSVASLFTLWLLDAIEPGKRRPLCITFGSPLIGDTSLQQILENSVRNSCFLHVVATEGPVPKLVIPQDRSQTATVFRPFGTFLLYHESRSVCVEDPDAVLELLDGVNGGQIFDDWRIYGEFLQCMERFSVLMGASEPSSDWILSGMFSQPDQMGRGIQDNMNARVICDIIMRMEERAKKKLRFDPFKKLNNMKIIMAHLEWYKKVCRTKGIGYYDHFRNHSSDSEIIATMEKYKQELTDYWKSLVEEAEKMPQSETAVFKRRFLFGGHNYRRMVEPLDIAEHYRSGLRDYQTRRSRHYVLLQKWFEQADKPENGSVKKPKNRLARQDSIDLLTLDSCFWAEVEEAMIAIKTLKESGIRDDKRELLTGQLHGFERYVWELIGEHAVSPEIFLEGSSFMRWWSEYKTFKGIAYGSPFADFMNKGRYLRYGVCA